MLPDISQIDMQNRRQEHTQNHTKPAAAEIATVENRADQLKQSSHVMRSSCMIAAITDQGPTPTIDGGMQGVKFGLQSWYLQTESVLVQEGHP